MHQARPRALGSSHDVSRTRGASSGLPDETAGCPIHSEKRCAANEAEKIKKCTANEPERPERCIFLKGKIHRKQAHHESFDSRNRIKAYLGLSGDQVCLAGLGTGENFGTFPRWWTANQLLESSPWWKVLKCNSGKATVRTAEMPAHIKNRKLQRRR